MVSPQAQQPIFRPLEQLRAHELVADQIRRQIALRLVSPGQSLPPERELARLFGVGRATVQQAIELLEGERLLESRRGRSGGTFVVGSTQGDETPVGVLDRVRKEREAILEALVFRAELEPAAAAAAAGARSQRDLAAMKAACRAAAATEDDAEFMEHDTELHLALGRATGNRYFAESTRAPPTRPERRARGAARLGSVARPFEPRARSPPRRARGRRRACGTQGDAGPCVAYGPERSRTNGCSLRPFDRRRDGRIDSFGLESSPLLGGS